MDSDTPLLIDMNRATVTLPCEICSCDVVIDVIEYDPLDATICDGCAADFAELLF